MKKYLKLGRFVNLMRTHYEPSITSSKMKSSML
jgi:hypothetical protein